MTARAGGTVFARLQRAIGDFVEMLNRQGGTIEPEQWEEIEQLRGTILAYAVSFYDHYFALRCAAAHVINDDTVAQAIINHMAGLAWMFLRNAEGLSSDTRARLERIRDTDPEFEGE